MRKAFYCEEINFAGQFIPVIYYDELPTSSVNGKEGIRQRRNIHDISELVEGDEYPGSILFLQKLYNPPPPKKEKPMARPVKGFLSATGQFYDTLAEAEFHDASNEIFDSMRKIVAQQFPNATSEQISEIVDFMVREIYKNKDIIRDFINTKEKLLDPKEKENDKLREPLEVDTEGPYKTPSEGA